MKIIIAVSALALSLGACSASRQARDINGAAIGGVGGAVIGGVASGSVGGAVIGGVASGSVGGAVVGGVVGAAGGALIADATRPRHHRRCFFSESRGRTVCR